MAKFTDQELSEKASAVYAEAEQHYKGSEITVDILMRIANYGAYLEVQNTHRKFIHIQIKKVCFYGACC